MSKSVPQLTEKTDREDDDLFHIVRGNIDYKQKRSNMFPAGADTIYFGSLTITSAQVLALNGTPLSFIVSPGSGKAIELTAFSASITFNSAAYATNVSLNAYTDTATESQFTITNFLNATVTRMLRGFPTAVSGATKTQIIANKAVYVKVDTGNPTTGDSDITIYFSYKIITL
jgi:hypothetical protein